MSSNAGRVINELSSAIDTFASQVDVKIDNIEEHVAETKRTADTAIEKIKNFREDVIANELMQAAHENVLRLDQQIREKFEPNIKVRRTISGVVKDFDINLCRNSTIEELSEELWITNSRYWLSFALIAISAWVNDSKTLAKNAVSESARTDAIKSSLFFCLVNLRFGRYEVAKKWLLCYFKQVVPTDLQNETAIIIQSFINGVFGVDKSLEYEVQKTVDEWVAQINIEEGIPESLIHDFDQYIANINVTERINVSTLAQYCSVADKLVKACRESFKYAALIKAIDEVDVELIVQNAENYKARIDNIINDLISNYDAEEQEIRNQREYYQLIMDNKGKLDVAEAQYEEIMRVRNQTQNFGRKLVEWAIYDNEVDVHVKKFAFQNSKEWFTASLDKWSGAMENDFPTSYPIKIDDYSCESNGEDQIEQEERFSAHLNDHKFRKTYVNAPNVLLLIFILIATTLSVVLGVVLGKTIPALIVGGIAVILFIPFLIRILTAASKFRKAVKAKMDIMTACLDELTQARKAYFTNIQNKNKLYSKIEHL